MNYNKVFQGISKSTQRKFIVTTLRDLANKGFEKVCIPFAGEFTLATCAIEAGYKPENIYCSDISIYSSIIGAVYSGTPVMDVDFEIDSDWNIEDYHTDEEKAGFVIWLMKVLQLKQHQEYENNIRLHLIHTKEEQIKHLAEQLKNAKVKYQGMTYVREDARDTLKSDFLDDKTVVLLHPPAYAKGYEKQFDFDGIIMSDFSCPEFDFKAEFVDMFLKSTESPAFFIWSSYSPQKDIDQKYVFFAEQVSGDRYEYYLINKPELAEEMKLSRSVFYKKDKLTQPPFKIVPEDFAITADTKITVKPVQADIALYYRDLWAHKLGITKAEIYHLIMLDGMVFGVVGWHLSDVVRLRSDEVFEVFGFDAPLNNHPTSHRLFMMFLCCNEMKRILMNGVSKNRIFEIKTFKTTCMTKYRKLKSSNGLLDIVHREKLPDGNYKLLYKKQFYKRDFKQCILDWEEENRLNPMSKNRARIDLEEGDD